MSLDRIDLQHVQETALTRGAQITKQLIGKMIDDARTRLESAAPAEVPLLQGQIRAWRDVLAIPEKVKAEVERQLQARKAKG